MINDQAQADENTHYRLEISIKKVIFKNYLIFHPSRKVLPLPVFLAWVLIYTFNILYLEPSSPVL